jgi:hypothetical protein
MLLWAREVIRNSIAVRSRQWYVGDAVVALQVQYNLRRASP